VFIFFYSFQHKNSGMILTTVNRADKRMYCPTDTLSTKNCTWTGLGL